MISPINELDRDCAQKKPLCKILVKYIQAFGRHCSYTLTHKRDLFSLPQSKKTTLTALAHPQMLIKSRPCHLVLPNTVSNPCTCHGSSIDNLTFFWPGSTRSHFINILFPLVEVGWKQGSIIRFAWRWTQVRVSQVISWATPPHQNPTKVPPPLPTPLSCISDHTICDQVSELGLLQEHSRFLLRLFWNHKQQQKREGIPTRHSIDELFTR